MRANEELKPRSRNVNASKTAIRLANRKLNTLSSITRHDILNQITAVVMYLSLTEESETDPEVTGNLKKIEKITQLIQNRSGSPGLPGYRCERAALAERYLDNYQCGLPGLISRSGD